MGPIYESFDSLGRLPAGSTILDVPCGGGVALRGLRPDQSFRYLGCDISPEMIERAERRAAKRGLSNVELIEADMRELPLPDQIADVCLCHSGLELISEPERAIWELVRCLRPGGTIVGNTMVEEGTRRQRAILAIQRRRGQPASIGSVSQLEAWLARCGLVDIEIERDWGFVLFSARKEG